MSIRTRDIAVVVGMVFGSMLSYPLYAADRSDQPPIVTQGESPQKSDGVIGISLHIGAERVGDPASLYVGKVYREGPAHKAGLHHGDELVSVDGTPVSGKNYEQVVMMVRGEAGTTVKLGVKREGEGLREVSVNRVAGDTLMKGQGPHGTYKDKQ